ncbi:hypothetical protein [Flavobacterium cerinum]|uniref:Uncharacterized protein n=1 Tax=Flavobacterium cerinum TaxID=2502784 RepID=A0A444GN09_9FLAO|nr:hypothetical protein [Flavobacterium cerinum]RWW92324.1 hypothetical protein EPI11_15550 [Flavobacterium cerinum]
MDTEKTGSIFSLLIGLPIGLAMGTMALSASKFYPFRFLLNLASFKLFWNPAVWTLIAAALAIILWRTGKTIAPNLEKKDMLRTSFLFTFLVTVKLFVFIAAIYFIAIIAQWIRIGDAAFLAIVPYSLIAMIFFFAFTTVIVAFTGGLLVVYLTKQKLKIMQGTQ